MAPGFYSAAARSCLAEIRRRAAAMPEKRTAAAIFAAVGAVWAALKPAKITRAAADVLYLFIPLKL